MATFVLLLVDDMEVLRSFFRASREIADANVVLPVCVMAANCLLAQAHVLMAAGVARSAPGINQVDGFPYIPNSVVSWGVPDD